MCDLSHFDLEIVLIFVTKGKEVVTLVYLFGWLECVGHSFAYVAHFVFLRVAWIRTQIAAEFFVVFNRAVFTHWAMDWDRTMI
jgi:hypothetical protein